MFFNTPATKPLYHFEEKTLNTNGKREINEAKTGTAYLNLDIVKICDNDFITS